MSMTPEISPTPNFQRARSTSPVSPALLPVPLIQPRYQKKLRGYNEMTVTESAGESDTDVACATEILKRRSVEALTIRSGKHVHQEQVSYHAYACFRLGNTVHSRSVGYSSEGDLVLHKHEVSESESDAKCRRVQAAVDGVVCLNPAARRQLSDEEAKSDKKIPAHRLKKYPGVKCPKNRKIRNRLMNDHFSTGQARKLYEAAFDDEWEDMGGDDECGLAAFDPPESFTKLLHKEEDVQHRLLERMGVSMKNAPRFNDPKDPNSADFRFAQLPNRLKDEVTRALQTSEFMSSLVADLEKSFRQYITEGDTTPMKVALSDGYGRLICHAVAGFYKLQSQSMDEPCSGERVTVVRFSGKAPELPFQSLLQFLGRGPRGDSPSRDSTSPSPTPDRTSRRKWIKKTAFCV